MNQMRTLAFTIMVGSLLLAAAGQREVAADAWPMVHRDAQRSGHTPEVVQGPYERKWFRDFHDELIATRVQAIVADGRVYVPTLAGNLYALDIADGGTVWTLKTRGPLGASPSYADGRLYQGSDDGNVYCIEAATGEIVWRYPAEAGVLVSPLVGEEHVYLGDRAGIFHAVDKATGEAAWTHRAGGMILTTASLDADRVVFAAEDMRLYSMSRDGELRWRSDKLGGQSLRDQAVTIWGDLAIVRSNPFASFHGAFGMASAGYRRIHEAEPMRDDDEVLDERWGRFSLRWTPRRQRIEREGVLAYLERNPHEQTTHAVRLADGEKPWIVAAPYAASGLHNPPSTPTFNPRTCEIYFWGGSALAAISPGVPGGGQVVYSMDRSTGELTNVTREHDTEELTGGFGQPADEAQALSLMGDYLINTHQGSILALNLRTGELMPIYRARDSYAGIHGVSRHRTQSPSENFYTGSRVAHNAGILSGVANEWHGPARGVVSIAEGRIFWVAGAQVVCIAGPNVERAETGGTGFPEEIEHREQMIVPVGNIATGSAGSFDADLPVRPITVDDVRPFIEPPTQPVPTDAEAAPLRKKLDAAVNELIDEQAWAPLMIELGIVGRQPFFYRADEAMRIVATALPQMSQPVRERAIAWLDAQFAAGHPLERVTWPLDEGRRREPYAVPDDVASVDHRVRREVDDAQPTVAVLYGLWAYAHHGDRWDRVLAELETVEQLYADFADKPLDFEHAGNAIDDNGDIHFFVNNAAERLNGQIAGTLGYIRIMQHAGRSDAAEVAMTKLAELVELRIHHERADTCYIRQDVLGNHSARLPRYLMLTPETGTMLRTFADDVTPRALTKLRSQLPVWHHAYGERLIGGENYINPPHLARALFTASAWADNLRRDQLARFIDQPWAPADLYYIEKLAATLSAAPPR